MIVGAAYGSNLANAISLKNGVAVLMVSYLMLSLGIGLSSLILGIYLWRLMSCQLPPREAIVSTFVPVGPPSMAAFTFLNLAVALSRNVTHGNFDFRETWEPTITPATRAAVAEMIMWIGVLLCLFFLGIATFFLIEAVASVTTRVPKTFNIGLWGFVFPFGVYANAFCRLSTVLRNDGMKGWATACVLCTVLLWLMCAFLTTYKAVWQGKLFFAPGLQGWVEQKQLDEISQKTGASKDQVLDNAWSSSRSEDGTLTRRQPNNDGTYEPAITRSKTSQSV